MTALILLAFSVLIVVVGTIHVVVVRPRINSGEQATRNISPL
jgi:hypothetical protein